MNGLLPPPGQINATIEFHYLPSCMPTICSYNCFTMFRHTLYILYKVIYI
jgi:hypothetical protein